MTITFPTQVLCRGGHGGCEYPSHFSTDFMHKFDVATLAQAKALGDIEFAQPKETLPLVTVGKSADLTLAPAAVASTKNWGESQ